jgi:hypothetical protein
VSIDFTIETSDATRMAQDKSHMWLFCGRVNDKVRVSPLVRVRSDLSGSETVRSEP